VFKDAKEAVKFIKEKGIAYVDLRFSDLPGRWQHFTVPAHEADENFFKHGAGFDGSSIRPG